MPRGSNQKFKFTYLMKIMAEKTDDEHSLTMPQILEELEKYEVSAERKSIYEDFFSRHLLRTFQAPQVFEA